MVENPKDRFSHNMAHIYFQADLIKLSTLPILKRFLGTDEGLELKVSQASEEQISPHFFCVHFSGGGGGHYRQSSILGSHLPIRLLVFALTK